MTSIDTLAPPGMSGDGGSGSSSKMVGNDETGLPDYCGGRLAVPYRSESISADHSPTSPGFHRRRKLSTASKVRRCHT